MKMEGIMVNRKYKDRLFCLLFGNEEYKENILSLYNALCGTSHTNMDDIQIYTIDDVIYIKMKNDVYQQPSRLRPYPMGEQRRE